MPADLPPHARPEYWISRDQKVAELLWFGRQPGWEEVGALFAALPPQAKLEAARVRCRPEMWKSVLVDLTQKYARSARGKNDFADAELPVEPRLPLLTAAEARETVGYLQLLEQLDLTPRGESAGQLAADLSRRLPAE